MVCPKEPVHFHALTAILFADSDKADHCLWSRFLCLMKSQEFLSEVCTKIQSTSGVKQEFNEGANELIYQFHISYPKWSLPWYIRPLKLIDRLQ